MLGRYIYTSHTLYFVCFPFVFVKDGSVGTPLGRRAQGVQGTISPSNKREKQKSEGEKGCDFELLITDFCQNL